jgi:hypothetical protein
MGKVEQDDFTTTSEGQEKYLRELSITPVGYIVLHRSYKKSLPCSVPHGNYFAWRKLGISEEQE